MSNDPTSQANFLYVASEHIHFDWSINWDASAIFGSATHSLLVKESGVKEVMLVYLTWIPFLRTCLLK